ncbi:hypothetical protein KY331_06095 [Candidatus Woesearchaeota archaeon]|nr:hypothetical protein [Candidatus Woesearchaeota archaeon]
MTRKKSFNEETEDESVYSEDAREELLEDSEISPEEEAFMRGYEEAVPEDKKTEAEMEEEE